MARVLILILASFVLFLGNYSSAQLSVNFYASSCPAVLLIVRSSVRTAVLSEARMGASLLRLFSQDCFVNGCDASILLDDTPDFTGEKTADSNANSVRGFEVIDNIKAAVEAVCPGVVSCADILAIAAHDAAVFLRGPNWEVKLGRRDATTASLSQANSDIPGPNSTLGQLVSRFAALGLSVRDMVALLGAHTIGYARCVTFRDRAYNATNIDPEYAATLRALCPNSPDSGDNNLTPLDRQTQNVFDNGYFRNLVQQMGLLQSDQVLFDGGSTDSIVMNYVANSVLFRNDFAAAMVRMGNISPLTGSDGEIRNNCRRVN